MCDTRSNRDILRIIELRKSLTNLYIIFVNKINFKDDDTDGINIG